VCPTLHLRISGAIGPLRKPLLDDLRYKRFSLRAEPRESSVIGCSRGINDEGSTQEPNSLSMFINDALKLRSCACYMWSKILKPIGFLALLTPKEPTLPTVVKLNKTNSQVFLQSHRCLSKMNPMPPTLCLRNHWKMCHLPLRNATLRIEFPPSCVLVGVYRWFTDKNLYKPAWDKFKYGTRRGAIVGEM
jgi:hypothetical protein